MPSFINPGLSKHYSSYVGDVSGQLLEKGKYARVVDVILDSSHPRFEQLGGYQALYGVFYQPLFESAIEDSDRPDKYGLRFAYCKQNPLRQIPVKSEIVSLETCLSALGVEDDGSNSVREKTYWTSIVPVWNHPHLNSYPDTIKFQNSGQETVDLGPDFEENIDIKPLQLSIGDVSLEGRHGQSLRFGGTKSKVGSLSDSNSNGKPFTIIRNGQAKTPGSVCIEDVNKDDASIYLVSDHKVPIVEANRKFAAARKAPDFAKDYQGKQIVLNSDRLILNARENDIELAAKGHLGENAKTVSIDGDDYLGLDATKIYLGSHAQKELNPVLKGQEAVDLLNDAFTVISSFLKVLSSAPPEPYAWTSTAKVVAGTTETSLKSILARIDSIKSKKVYTE